MNTDDRGRNLADSELNRRKQFGFSQEKWFACIPEPSDRELAIDEYLRRVVELWIDDNVFEQGTAVYVMRRIEKISEMTDAEFNAKYRSNLDV